MSGRDGKGFTLVEMLVVIVILGILFAMFMPVMGRIRERGWRTQCASNLKQLHAAVVTYATDSAQYPPPATWIDETRGMNYIVSGWINWVDDNSPDSYAYVGNAARVNVERGRLWPYLQGQMKVLVCPTHRQHHATPDALVRSYGISGLMYPPPGNPQETYGRNFFGLREASSQPLFADVHDARLASARSGSFFAVTNGAASHLGHRHPAGGRQGANMVFADGHIEFIVR